MSDLILYNASIDRGTHQGERTAIALHVSLPNQTTVNSSFQKLFPTTPMTFPPLKRAISLARTKNDALTTG